MLDLFVQEVERYLRLGVLSPEDGKPLAEAGRQILRHLRAT